MCSIWAVPGHVSSSAAKRASAAASIAAGVSSGLGGGTRFANAWGETLGSAMYLWGADCAIITHWLRRELNGDVGRYVPGTGVMLRDADFMQNGRSSFHTPWVYAFAIGETFALNLPWLPAPIPNATLEQVLIESFGFQVNVLPESWYTDAEAAADEAAMAAHVAAAGAPAPV